MAVRARVVNHNGVARGQSGQQAIDGEFVVVFAKRAGNIIQDVVGAPFLADDGDVMVGAVKCGPHQVGHAGIEAGEFFVRVLDVQDFRDKVAVRAGDEASAFRKNFQGGHAAGRDDLFILFPDAAGHNLQIDGFLFGPVGNSESSAQVCEFKADVQGVG